MIHSRYWIKHLELVNKGSNTRVCLNRHICMSHLSTAMCPPPFSSLSLSLVSFSLTHSSHRFFFAIFLPHFSSFSPLHLLCHPIDRPLHHLTTRLTQCSVATHHRRHDHVGELWDHVDFSTLTGRLSCALSLSFSLALAIFFVHTRLRPISPTYTSPLLPSTSRWPSPFNGDQSFNLPALSPSLIGSHPAAAFRDTASYTLCTHMTCRRSHDSLCSLSLSLSLLNTADSHNVVHKLQAFSFMLYCRCFSWRFPRITRGFTRESDTLNATITSWRTWRLTLSHASRKNWKWNMKGRE